MVKKGGRVVIKQSFTYQTRRKYAPGLQLEWKI